MYVLRVFVCASLQDGGLRAMYSIRLYWRCWIYAILKGIKVEFLVCVRMIVCLFMHEPARVRVMELLDLSQLKGHLRGAGKALPCIMYVFVCVHVCACARVFVRVVYHFHVLLFCMLAFAILL